MLLAWHQNGQLDREKSCRSSFPSEDLWRLGLTVAEPEKTGQITRSQEIVCVSVNVSNVPSNVSVVCADHRDA